MRNSRSLYSGATPEQVAADLAELVDFQEEGLPLPELADMLLQRLEPHLMRYDAPGFQSMFNAIPDDSARLGGEWMIRFNQGVTNWQVSPGGTVLEELCARALCRLFGLAEGADATFMYSGTYANHQALYMALHRHAERRGVDFVNRGLAAFKHPERLTILVSADAHFSLRHAVRLLGLGENALLKAPVDARRRLDVDAARAVLARHPEREIVCVVATAGTTSTGAVDPLAALADLADEHGAWFHVDGAYGYAYRLVPDWAHLFEGDKQADSITWDPHKQLGAPIPSSLLFLRDGGEFRRMALFSDYFNRRGDAVPNPGLKSPPSTRPLAALPVVTILRGKGIRRVREELRSPLAAIRELARKVHSLPDVQVAHEPDTGILCFQVERPGLAAAEVDQLQYSLYERIMASGNRTISITRLADRPVLRLAVVSPNTTTEKLMETVDLARKMAAAQE